MISKFLPFPVKPILILFLPLSLCPATGLHAQGPTPTLPELDGSDQEHDPDQVENVSPLDRRITLEQLTSTSRFVITPHKPSYIMPLTYDSNINERAYEEFDGDLDNLEMKYQISLKFTVWQEIFGDNGFLSFGYTQMSFWQAYNSDLSSPFRETDYEPELMLTFLTDYEIATLRNRVVVLGLAHQSNGKGGEFSRSWNRVYANFILEKAGLVFSIKPWYRLPEDRDEDDNPDIDDYYGYGEITAAYRAGSDHVFSLMVRNNFRPENRGAVQIDWSFPINERINGFVQYFNGYGESLIDYNDASNRFGVGVLVTNWL